MLVSDTDTDTDSNSASPFGNSPHCTTAPPLCTATASFQL
jgi:hypothetical protein